MHDQTTATYGMPLQHGDRSPQKKATLTSNIGALRHGKRSQHDKRSQTSSKEVVARSRRAAKLLWKGAKQRANSMMVKLLSLSLYGVHLQLQTCYLQNHKAKSHGSLHAVGLRCHLPCAQDAAHEEPCVFFVRLVDSRLSTCSSVCELSMICHSKYSHSKCSHSKYSSP